MSHHIKYRIDPYDNIVLVNSQWDAFAVENGGEALVNETVGKSIWDFLGDEEVTTLYQELFGAVRRTEKSTRLHFRCDSHEVLRFMLMQISSIGDGYLDVETQLLREVARQEVLKREIFYLGISNGVPMCSHCNKVYIHTKDHWMEIDMALRNRWIPTELKVAFKICPTCKSDIQHHTKSLVNKVH